MNATTLTSFQFQKRSSRSYGMVAHFGKPAYEEAVRNVCNLAAVLPFSSLRVERDYNLQNLERALPQLRLAPQLRSMNITTTPLCVYDAKGQTLGILSECGALYITANAQEEWDRLYRIDLNQADEPRRKRAAYYLARTGLECPAGLDLPALTNEEMAQLDKKCPDGLLFPHLNRGGAWMPIFNTSETITVARRPKQETNPRIWYDSVNMGVLLPMAPTFVDKLNSGSVSGFEAQVREIPDSNQLEVQVQFDTGGEHYTHSTRRPVVNLASGATLCVPFGEYGAFVHSGADLHLEPCVDCHSFSQEAGDWNVTSIQGGVNYVRVLVNGQDQGMLRLPQFPERQHDAEKNILSADIGESHFALATTVNGDNPCPVVFNSALDCYPLIYANERNRAAICNHSWFPKDFRGMARSVAQFFRAPDGNLHDDPLPYSVCRSFTDDSIASITLARTLENGLSTGFKGDMIRSQNDEIKEYSYQGYVASILLLGIQQALQSGSRIDLRLSYPNNHQFMLRFQNQVNRALQLIHRTLIDKHGEGFSFHSVDYRTEAFCCTVSIERLGLNNRLGAFFRNYLSADGGGSTTDLAVRTSDADKFQMVSIPLAGKTVTLSSLIQVARCLQSDTESGLSRFLRNPDPALGSLLEQQLVTPILRKLHTAAGTADTLVQLTTDDELLETCQTVIDHFELDLTPNAQLLRALICMKDLLLMDIVLHQSRQVFTDAHLAQSKLHLLRLGNGSKSVGLICDPRNRFQNGRQEMDEILAHRAVSHLGENARLSVEYNTRPKTEVVYGLCAYTSDDGQKILDYSYTDPVSDLSELEEKYLPQAIEQVCELASWLRTSVPRIVGSIHPYYSGLECGFDQLLAQFEEPDSARTVLLDTLSHERGRFGQLHKTSASLGLDIWAMYAILDSADRQLALAQAAAMEKKGIAK